MVKVKLFVVGLLETNCYIVYDAKDRYGILIDPGFFDSGISDFIEKNDIRIKNIVNTHGHIDHTAGNSAFGYPVLIHKKDSFLLQAPDMNLAGYTGTAFTPCRPQKLLNEGDVIKFGKNALEVLHTPGHTPGSICLKIEDLLFTGDTIFKGGVGRTDFSYSNERMLMDSIKNKIIKMEDNTRIYPGHGQMSNIGFEKTHNPFLIYV